MKPRESGAQESASPLLRRAPVAAPALGIDAPNAREALEGERRQITVLFCDIVGATELAGTLDPEDLRDLLSSYHETCAAVIARFEGHVAQYLGDGMLVYFGHPVAHEDDAVRAVRSGLGIQEAVAGLNSRLVTEAGLRLAVRVGIHTGLVVMGSVGGRGHLELLAVGEAPNVAARLQALADPDTVVVSGDTHRLVASRFDCDDLGPQALKGVARPLAVHRVLHESAARHRLGAHAPAAGPMVGREREERALLERWRAVAERGEGQAVLVGGEPGIGKTRLVRALADHVAGDPSAWLTAIQCSANLQDTSLHPIVELLERVVLQLAPDDTAERRLAKLEGWLAQTGLVLASSVPLFATLLSLPLGERFAPLASTPERQRQELLDALVEILLVRARAQPLLVVMEDLQWADPTTLELLQRLVQAVPGSRCLMVLTHRPDFAPPALWNEGGALTALGLGRLDSGAAAQVARGAVEAALPGEILDHIVERTDGVPLFVEELTRAVVESGAVRASDGRVELVGALAQRGIPTTLADSLAARLDRLPAGKQVAQLGATLGREFSFELLQAVCPLDETALRRDLAAIVAAGIMEARPAAATESFAFRHALIQEAAYHSLLRRTRRAHHERVARVIEERFPGTAQTTPEVVAHHYTQAGRPAEAIPLWVEAGQRALQRSANLESVSHLQTALGQLETLPDGQARAQQEVGLRVLMAVPLTLTRGWAAPEVGAAYERARELCEQIGEVPQLFPALVGVLTYYLVRGDFRTAYDMGLRNLEVAERSASPDLLVEAEHDRGTTSFYRGRLHEALDHLQRVAEIYDPERHHHHAYTYGKDPGAIALTHEAVAWACVGRLDHALGRADAATALMERWPHPFSYVWTLIGRASALVIRGDVEAAGSVGERIVALGVEGVFPNWIAQGNAYAGWAMVHRGEIDAGLERLREGLALWRLTGAELYTTMLLWMLADGYRVVGRPGDARATLQECLDQVERTDERFWEAELHRLNGQLLLTEEPAGSADVEAAFQRALDRARSRESHTLELRAATSLAGLWADQGREADARGLLEPVLAWFDEGLDTPYVRLAGAILAGLASAGRERA